MRRHERKHGGEVVDDAGEEGGTVGMKSGGKGRSVTSLSAERKQRMEREKGMA
jgi:hypothetical protein